MGEKCFTLKQIQHGKVIKQVKKAIYWLKIIKKQQKIE